MTDSLWYIATRAGVSGRSDNWVLNYVRMLHANENFPDPLPAFRIATGKKAEGITFLSRWPRPAVDAWFDGFLPPMVATVPDEGAIAACHADALDASARQLAGAAA